MGRTTEVEVVWPEVKPILKWPGGKQWLSVAAPDLAPKNWTGRYFEPFLGGGAFFFALEPGRATVGDVNPELVETYRAIKHDPEAVIRLLRTYPYNEEFYYRLRARAPRTRNARAARMLYLNRACWNGLYRVNSKGQFNTPYGRYVNPTICHADRIRAGAKLLHRARIVQGDFGVIEEDVGEGDFVFFDPPYISGHQDNGFVKYNAALFSWDDQKRLAELAGRLVRQGAYVLSTNAQHASIRSLYPGFNCYSVTRNNLISGTMSTRGKGTEMLLASYRLLDQVGG